jgi:pimeloyl-ACP methyl ester carboxylesterase
VQLSARKLAVALLAASALLCALALSARGAIDFKPCPDTNDFACARLTVGLDPSGATAGTISLAMRRHRAPVDGPSSAVIALAGGPGQEALPLAEQFASLLGPVVATRDLIVFDQRGTGHSGRLACPRGRGGHRAHVSLPQFVVRCAGQIGPARAFYTTPDSVADIEAIREAGGYEKLVLYGTSYGTKVAEQYAETYPSHVEALVLDSVVPPNGPDPLNRPTFAAVPRVLRQLCAFHECRHITREPVADLTRLVRRMARGTIAGSVIDGRGHRRRETISSGDLLGVLLEGDFNPLLRAEMIPAARAAATGDTAELARLLVRAESAEGSDGVDAPLYLATSCEEEQFPWSRAAAPQQRLAQARAAIGALPASALLPFTAANVFQLGDLRACAFWPFATPAPPLASAPLPNVPTLIVSGAADLRTPTANAREVAAQIPDARLLVIPYAGHSALGNEPTKCGVNALHAMFAGGDVKPCRLTPPPAIVKLPPLPPRRLAEVTPTRGYRGLPGRTLHAVTLTLGDFVRQFLLQLLEGPGLLHPFRASSLGSGGLRAGWVSFGGGAFHFHGYSYVPGVSISGTLAAGHVLLRIGGAAAAHGTLRLDAHRAIVGALGGRRVHLAPHRRRGTALLARAGVQPLPVLEARVATFLRRFDGTLASLPGIEIDPAEAPFLATRHPL